MPTSDIKKGPLYVDSTNNRIGVGTASPSYLIDAQTASGNAQVQIKSGGDLAQLILQSADTTGNSQINFADADSSNIGMLQYFHSDNHMEFTVNSSEAMRIDSSGNLLLQKTSATNSGAGTYFQVPTTPTTMPVYLHFCKTFSGARDAIDFNHNGSRVGSVQFDNTSTSYNTSSDYRLKENVVADWDATTRLNQLNPVRFNFIANPDTTVDGFLAHEVQSVVPEAISGTHNEVDDDGNPVYQGIDQSKLTPLLTKALIEAVEKIEQLETRIAALEAN
jgi:hypothetical protein